VEDALVAVATGVARRAFAATATAAVIPAFLLLAGSIAFSHAKEDGAERLLHRTLATHAATAVRTTVLPETVGYADAQAVRAYVQQPLADAAQIAAAVISTLQTLARRLAMADPLKAYILDPGTLPATAAATVISTFLAHTIGDALACPLETDVLGAGAYPALTAAPVRAALLLGTVGLAGALHLQRETAKSAIVAIHHNVVVVT